MPFLCFLGAFECFNDNNALAFIPLNFWRIKRLFQLSTKAVIPANGGWGANYSASSLVLA